MPSESIDSKLPGPGLRVWEIAMQSSVVFTITPSHTFPPDRVLRVAPYLTNYLSCRNLL